MLHRLFGEAVRFSDFRKFFVGQVISSVGTWLQGAVVGWKVFELSHSEAAIGINAALLVVPVVVLSPLVGMVIDMFPTKRVLVATSSAAMAQAGILAVLAYHSHLTLWNLNALTLVLGIISAFDGAARQVNIREIIPPGAVRSGISLNSSLVSAGVMLGMALAGPFIRIGYGVTFAFNALTYIPVIVTVLSMQFLYASDKQATASWKRMRPGIRDVFFDHKELRVLLALLFLSMAFSFPYRTLMPAIAQVLFHGSAMTFGLLGAMPGLGAVIAGVTISRCSERISYRALVGLGLVLIGTSLTLFQEVRSVPMAMLLFFCTGFGALVVSATLRSRIQSMAKNHLVGRITSYSQMSFVGGIACGNAGVGHLAQVAGLSWSITVCGIALLGTALLLYWLPLSGYAAE